MWRICMQNSIDFSLQYQQYCCSIHKEIICPLILIHHMSRHGQIGQEFHCSDTFDIKKQGGTH